MDTSWLGPGDLTRFSREQYDRLVEAGAFQDTPVELLHGLLLVKEPQGPEHATVASRLHRALLLALDRHAEIRSHSPFAASDDSEPEPDVAVVPRAYDRTDHPANAFLVVEIARSSLRRDRSVKADLYAAAAIPEYWIVNLENRTVEVRTDPAGGTYRRLETLTPADRITLASFPDVTLSIADFL